MKQLITLIALLPFHFGKAQECKPIRLLHSNYPGYEIEYKNNKVFRHIGFPIDIDEYIYDSLNNLVRINTWNIINTENKSDTILDMIKVFKYSGKKIIKMEYYSGAVSVEMKVTDVDFYYNDSNRLSRNIISGQSGEKSLINFYWNSKNLKKIEVFDSTKNENPAEVYEFAEFDSNPNYERISEEIYIPFNFKALSQNNIKKMTYKTGNRITTISISYLYNKYGYPVRETGSNYEIDIDYKCEK